MRKKKLLILFMAAALIGSTVTGCENNSSGKTEEGEKSQNSGIQAPGGDILDEALMEEFEAANDMTVLCEKYGTVQVDSQYVYMDENGKKSSGGTATEQYYIKDNSLVWQLSSDGYESYQSGNKISYGYMEDNDAEYPISYTVNYNTDSFNEMYGEYMTNINSLYTGNEYANQCTYKQTSNGYEIYEVYDYGDGTGNVITYYTDKDKEVYKIESVTYPENAARYVDSTREVQTGVEVFDGIIEKFENGEVIVTVIEKASGTQTELKLPAGTEMFFCVTDSEIITLDEQGTQMIGESRYDTYITITESITLYVVESAVEDTGDYETEDQEIDDYEAVPVG